MHLTNVAIQKTAENYDKENDTKLDMLSLKVYSILHCIFII